jgi:hypothetical protein
VWKWSYESDIEIENWIYNFCDKSSSFCWVIAAVIDFFPNKSRLNVLFWEFLSILEVSKLLIIMSAKSTIDLLM